MDRGKGQDLSSAVLDWRDFSDTSCADIIDYLYTGKVSCLEDKRCLNSWKDVRHLLKNQKTVTLLQKIPRQF